MTPSAHGAREVDLAGRLLCQDARSSPEHQLSAQFINPAGDAHRSAQLLGQALAVPWQLLVCLGEGWRRMHITGTSTSSFSPQQICTVTAEKILVCIKLYEREMYSKETEKTGATSGYCYLLSIVSVLLGQ